MLDISSPLYTNSLSEVRICCYVTCNRSMRSPSANSTRHTHSRIPVTTIWPMAPNVHCLHKNFLLIQSGSAVILGKWNLCTHTHGFSCSYLSVVKPFNGWHLPSTCVTFLLRLFPHYVNKINPLCNRWQMGGKGLCPISFGLEGVGESIRPPRITRVFFFFVCFWRLDWWGLAFIYFLTLPARPLLGCDR